MKYLRLFKTTAAYDAAKDDLDFPNVSHCEDNKEVHYVPVPPPFFAKLYLNNGEVVKLQGSGELTQAMITPYKSSIVSVEIGKLCTSIGGYAFYQCKGITSITIPDSVTSIGGAAFQLCSNLTNVTIGSGITSIGSTAFGECSSLTSVTIGSSVTNIGWAAFSSCTSLTNIISLATTAPTIQSWTFKSIKTGGTLTVPSGSTGYDVWMGTRDYYLGMYSWTKVEQ